MHETEALRDRVAAGLRVLLVEDNVQGRKSLTRLLELRGHNVVAVADGESALEALRGSGPFDVVLTDLMLPDTDGREISRRVKALDPRPIVAITTGDAFAGELSPSEEDGIDLVYFKPLKIERILVEVCALQRERLRGSEDSR